MLTWPIGKLLYFFFFVERFTDTSIVYDCTRKGVEPDEEPDCIKSYKDNSELQNSLIFQSSLP